MIKVLEGLKMELWAGRATRKPHHKVTTCKLRRVYQPVTTRPAAQFSVPQQAPATTPRPSPVPIQGVSLSPVPPLRLPQIRRGLYD